MSETDIRINDIERTLDRIVLMQEQTTRNIDSITNDIRDFGCPKSECKALALRVSKIEGIMTKLNWLILGPVVTAVVYLVLNK